MQNRLTGNGVVGKEPAVRGVGRMKRQAEQPLLTPAGGDLRSDVEEGCGRRRAAAEDADAPGALADEHPPAVVAGVRHQQRLLQARGDWKHGDVGGEPGYIRCRTGLARHRDEHPAGQREHQEDA